LDHNITKGNFSCIFGDRAPYRAWESGGQYVRQPGQIRKEAAVTIFYWVARLLLYLHIIEIFRQALWHV